MSSQGRTIRVFVASPGDVHRERDAVLGAVNELNRFFDALLPDHGLQLRLVRWEADAYPAAGRPQGVINEQIGDYDIFIGIMWTRFGTKTGEADSGTQEEFNIAFERWQKHGTPKICFYFCNAAISPPRKADQIEQLERVASFRQDVMQNNLTWEYADYSVFPAIIRAHLAMIVGQEIRDGHSADEASSGAAPTFAKLAAASPVGQHAVLDDIGPNDACYRQREKYIGHPGTLIEATSREGWLAGTFQFAEPLFTGDNRMYTFRQFRVREE